MANTGYFEQLYDFEILRKLSTDSLMEKLEIDFKVETPRFYSLNPKKLKRRLIETWLCKRYGYCDIDKEHMKKRLES